MPGRPRRAAPFSAASSPRCRSVSSIGLSCALLPFSLHNPCHWGVAAFGLEGVTSTDLSLSRHGVIGSGPIAGLARPLTSAAAGAGAEADVIGSTPAHRVLIWPLPFFCSSDGHPDLFACEFFVNGVEWLGSGSQISRDGDRDDLAAFGTALPESVVTLVAVVFGQALPSARSASAPRSAGRSRLARWPMGWSA